MSAKHADGLARLWENREENFLFEQTGPPDYDDLTEFCLHDYKLTRTMRDILNQRIIFHLNDGTWDKKDLASFSALGYCNKISLYWCTIHQKRYCLHKFGSFKIPHLWQDLPVLSEAITICLKFFVRIITIKLCIVLSNSSLILIIVLHLVFYERKY